MFEKSDGVILYIGRTCINVKFKCDNETGPGKTKNNMEYYYFSKIDLVGGRKQLNKLKDNINNGYDLEELIIVDNNDYADISCQVVNTKMHWDKIYYNDKICIEIISKHCPTHDFAFCLEQYYGLDVLLSYEPIDNINEFLSNH